MPDQTHYLRGYRADTTGASDAPDAPMRFIASTADVARDGMIINADAWQLDSFRNNPVFLFAHDYTAPPIGQVQQIDVEKDRLVADVTFDADPFSQLVRAKYLSGSMRAVSVGWNTIEMAPGNGNEPMRVTKADLLDVSAVPVPADPKALKQHSARGLAAISRDMLALLESESTVAADASAVASERLKESIAKCGDSYDEYARAIGGATASMTWEDAAAAMVALHLPGLQRPDAERQAAYRRLSRVYATHGKHAPEYVPVDRLDAFDLGDVRGLLLEGETERFPGIFGRAGAVLSARNRSDLEQAVGLLTGVIERSVKAADDTTDPTPERAIEPNAELRRLHALFTQGPNTDA